jgi:hypothetical protein
MKNLSPCQLRKWDSYCGTGQFFIVLYPDSVGYYSLLESYGISNDWAGSFIERMSTLVQDD